MARTVVGINDPKAVRKYSAFLAVDVGRVSYFNKKFMGVGIEAQTPVQIIPDLEKDSGEQVAYDLVLQLRMQPVEGDNTLEGKEEDLKMYTDQVYIDQARGGVNTGGRMTRKRTIHDLRKIARGRQSEWWARVFDELFFLYLGGGFRTAGQGAASHLTGDYTYSNGYQGFAGNPFIAPDTNHSMVANQKTFATLVATDTLQLIDLDRAVARCSTLGGGTAGIPMMEPIMLDGEEKWVCVMHPWAEFYLRTSTQAGQWFDIAKAAAAAEGRSSPIFKGAMGEYNGVVLHKHRASLRRVDAGAGANISATRSLFMGRQAGVVAFGSPGSGLRFDWNEETRDNGNQVVITTNSIFGIKKTRFTVEGQDYDFGLIGIDSAAPNPAP
jgi:N4-gp56 family major capsid protein